VAFDDQTKAYQKVILSSRSYLAERSLWWIPLPTSTMFYYFLLLLIIFIYRGFIL